jgi:DMSO/TMAO reductase YedYZ heme-binding membrane subunit
VATAVTQSSSERVHSATTWLVTALAAIVVPLAAGFGFARLFAPTVHSKYFPWITGRALGIAGYVSLTALVVLGMWMRHPLRVRRPIIHSETRLRLHATLGAATIALVVGHLIALASDSYAGVGWAGAFVPGLARYRTFAVSLGVISLFFMLVLSVSARTAGRRGARRWSTYHRFALLTFIAVWFHGVLAGTDTAELRVLYVVTGAGVGVLALTRYGATRWASLRSNDPEVGVASSQLQTVGAVETGRASW